MSKSKDTIFALSTGALPSGMAVIRISGPQAIVALQQLSGFVPVPRVATMARLTSKSGDLLDHAMALSFPAPKSFTGEDVAELQVHGGRATVSAIIRELDGFPDFRHAEPGEFTRRAFLNGKMDLTEVEGFADLLAAETEMQRRIAIINASGRLRLLHDDWRRRVIKIRALIEADLDFPDEDDVPGSVSDVARLEASRLKVDIDGHLGDYDRAEIIRNGFDVVIIGPPNAGKSSLLNALVSREAAIVTDEAGTTRDLIEVSLDVHGYKINVTDTAGIRETSSRVESIGIERALDRAKSADLILELSEDGAFNLQPPGFGASKIIRVRTKVENIQPSQLDGADCLISVNRPESIRNLMDIIGKYAELALDGARDILPLRERQRDLMSKASIEIELAIARWNQLELAGEHLRRASEALSHVTGHIGTEDLLDSVFRDFCIGK